MKSLLPLLLIISPLAVSCHGVSSPAAPAPAIFAQWSGVQGGAAQRSTRVIRTAGEWSALWSQVGRDVPRPLEVSREMGVVAFLGERTTGGYSVSVAGARIQDGRCVVEYRETAPAPDTLTTQALTYPWAFALVPKSDLPVEWRNLGASTDARAKNPPSPPPRAGTRQER